MYPLPPVAVSAPIDVRPSVRAGDVRLHDRGLRRGRRCGAVGVGGGDDGPDRRADVGGDQGVGRAGRAGDVGCSSRRTCRTGATGRRTRSGCRSRCRCVVVSCLALRGRAGDLTAARCWRAGCSYCRGWRRARRRAVGAGAAAEAGRWACRSRSRRRRRSGRSRRRRRSRPGRSSRRTSSRASSCRPEGSASPRAGSRPSRPPARPAIVTCWETATNRPVRRRCRRRPPPGSAGPSPPPRR